ncbi:hypothetical protein ACFOWX_07225 [Sphingorhabdus arenilitoris]|uniref:Uncharacterized protein n=1 Tax=Sphingorhabdus arenilitoris TaxID=1490041 RepID=A0ABV8RHJ0_9SPHN
MKPFRHLLFNVCMFSAASAFAQPAVIDLNAKPRPFTNDDFEALVVCSLDKNSDITRRYATYHLLRRDKQTWQENEADPDSKLLMPAIEGCIEFKNGEPMPFSIDALISRWGAAHGISQAVTVMDEASLAKCAVRSHEQLARVFVQVMADPSHKPAVRRMTATSLAAPPCEPAPNVTVNLIQLFGHVKAELQNGKATK